MPSVAELLILLAAVGGSGSMVGFLGWMLYRVNRLESRGVVDTEDLDRLMDHLDVLRNQLGSVREEMGELSGRVEFTERLLTSGKDENDADSAVEQQ